LKSWFSYFSLPSAGLQAHATTLGHIFLKFKSTKKGANIYLLAEEAVHQEDEDALQDVDDGEEVRHDLGSWTHLEDAQTPRAAQDEDLRCGFECQHPGGVTGWWEKL
jgi:hypothetical protein